MKIYFDINQPLLAEITKLEDDNLRKIELVQDDEQNLDRQKRSEKVNYQKMEDQIDEVQRNINVLQQQKFDLLSKQKYLSAGDVSKIGVTSPSGKSRGVTSRDSVRVKHADVADAAKQAEGDDSMATKQKGDNDAKS